MTIVVTPVFVLKKVSTQGLDLSLYTTDYFGTHGLEIEGVDAESRDSISNVDVERLHFQASQVRSVSDPVQVLKKVSAQALDLSSLMSDYDGMYFGIAMLDPFYSVPYTHTRGDDLGNTISDQTMRGGGGG